MPNQNFPSTLLLKYHPTQTSWHSFQSLFTRLTLLKILPNVECKKAKQEAFELSQYQACFDKMGIATLAICEEPTVGSTYMDGSWRGDLYLDLSFEVCQTPISNASREPSFFQPGGTYLVTEDCQVIYAYEPNLAMDSLSTGFILSLCLKYISSLKPSPASDQPKRESCDNARRSWASSEHLSDDYLESYHLI
ncbi:hypothetical protein DSO57_1003897 [Entomophthora muscae]|uniref:Uncharacterized protein n=1 Tax=Entomophthora muscae TaxID=34485 RepID=A0ACC2SAC9_9FUNG|nr:hypothetical protein DSO57_1003897 [Entomophthora muscae]